LTLVLACLLAPGARGGGRAQVVRDVALPVVAGALTAGLIVGGLAARPVGLLLMLVVPAMLCFGFSRRPLRFGLGIGAVRHAGAVLGLGAGALACYAAPGEVWDFYEIDPLVERIAREPAYFTYLRDCGPGARVILGDARLSLAKATRRYGLIVLDVYSSDAI